MTPRTHLGLAAVPDAQPFPEAWVLKLEHAVVGNEHPTGMVAIIDARAMRFYPEPVELILRIAADLYHGVVRTEGPR
jgi:hypothetical protein